MTSVNRLTSLTSLRFFAALLVVFQHYFGFSLGHSGVSFFYVLSGFILAYNYDRKLDAPGSWRTFFQKRFARIYPTHLATLIAALPFAGILVLHNRSTAALLAETISAQLVLAHAFVPVRQVYFGLNGVSWSISDEAFFYACFPLLLLALTRSSVRVRWTILSGWLALTVAVEALWIGTHPGSSSALAAEHWLFYVNPIFRLAEFAVGVGLGVDFRREPSRPLSTRHELLALGLVAATYATAGLVPARADILLLASWFVPASITVIYVFARSEGVFARLMAGRLPLLLGESSFMLYMLHVLVKQYAGLALEHLLGVSVPDWSLANAAIAAMAVALSVVGHLCFERPLQALLSPAKRKSRRASASPA